MILMPEALNSHELFALPCLEDKSPVRERPDLRPV